MREKSFQRKTEDFVCEKCGKENIGNGYTNHCKFCLWSKHVDVNPGDRAESCGGMMCPVKIDQEKGKYVITHKCEKCKFERRKVLEREDDFDSAIEITN
jgi:hypothetical protein